MTPSVNLSSLAQHPRDQAQIFPINVTSQKGLVRIHVSWVKATEVVGVPDCRTIFDALQIEVYNLVRGSAMEDPENFRKRKARRCRPHKWSPDTPSGKESDAAAI